MVTRGIWDAESQFESDIFNCALVDKLFLSPSYESRNIVLSILNLDIDILILYKYNSMVEYLSDTQATKVRFFLLVFKIVILKRKRFSFGF